ncbi:MAG: Rieske (2Fe-2S) domain-containing [Prolixibacteraceae bacterium]|nr:MAG: Rieske (2Fe-2S) domain-containing [Prolixibacteraceae bacterium]
MERRKFFRNFAVGGSLLLTAPVIFNSCSDDLTEDDNNNNNNTGGITVDLTDPDYAALKTVGGFAYKGDIIIIRSTETVYIALSKVCTHLQCTVTYSSSSKDIPCPCHGSKFNTEGAVLNGPAASPLKKYDVKQNGNTLTIS